jgi:hypothetical protein
MEQFKKEKFFLINDLPKFLPFGEVRRGHPSLRVLSEDKI